MSNGNIRLMADMAKYFELPTILTSSEKKQGVGELWSWIDTVLV